MTKAIEQNASRLINVVKNEEQHSGIAGEERLINEIFYNCMKETIANLKL